jgi:hypothetical protein
MHLRVQGAGGAICLSSSGEPAFYFTTERMAWAIAQGNIISWGLERDEHNSENVDLL